MEHNPTYTGNILEAVLWGAIALILCGFAVRDTGRKRRLWVFVAFAFSAFSISDIIEAHTGAWWHLGWLFAMKCTCVGMFLAGIRWFRVIVAEEKQKK